MHTLRSAAFRKKIIDYYRAHKRDLPWRSTRDPYAIMVSEVMLQQTQVDRVIPKYLAWMHRFPTPESLAHASVGDVLKVWQGLGYNRRALNLRRAAGIIVREQNGEFPKDVRAIDALPGIGPYTAGAIGAFAFEVRSAFIETNIRTVYLHFFFNGKTNVRDEELIARIEETLPQENIREWYNALMDYGAMLKRTVGNPNIYSASYAKQSTFKGSRRELRGAILRAAQSGSISERDFADHASQHSVTEVISQLVSEGFLKRKGKTYTVAS